jgi:hypothetical protein
MTRALYLVISTTFCLLGLAACGGAQTGSSGFVADVGYVSATAETAERRLSVPVPLKLYLGPKVQDAYTVQPSPHMKNNFSDFRRSVSDVIKNAFAPNFSTVDIEAAESRQGVELLILMASMQETNTIKYQAVLTLDGQEVIDITGETEGMIIQMGGSRQALMAQYPGKIEELTADALKKLGEAVYSGIMRSQKLEDEDFWDKLAGAAPAAGEAEAPAAEASGE